jgi:AmmeMemoRadiSam system protein A
MGESRLLTLDDRQRLLQLARRALAAKVLGLPLVESDDYASVASGAFVSIHRRGELRGCLGRLEPLPLAAMVRELARAVADSDPRFEAVAASELPEIDIEISVLTPQRRIDSPGEIEVGRHGVIVEQRGRRGLLLPQVAKVRGWDRLTFLEHACLKAGLPRDAWPRVDIFVFEAEVFGERSAASREEVDAGASDVAWDRCAASRTPSE